MRTLLLGALAAALLAAGCTSPPSHPAAPAARPALHEFGTVEGTVLDDELRPLPAADVGVPALRRTTSTDEAGHFRLGLPAGTHELQAVRLGHAAATLRLHVDAGATTGPVELRLDRLRLGEPAKDLQAQRGLFGCGASWRPAVVASGVAACGLLAGTPLDTSALDRFRLTWSLRDPVDEWRASVMEMRWTSNQVLGKGLAMRWEIDGCVNSGHGDLGSASGKSPVRLDDDTRDLHRALAAECGAEACSGGSCRLVSRVFATPETLGADAPADVGVVVQQGFDQYLSAFYNAAPPAGYSALG